ncbi:hypothetical protein [Flavobacterium nackdongense]|uniref:Beta-carotene 15,15'-monooxygenase n=1 Tax=Flavobacterium nackdongense TaxID=2547394 RepID=A0A4P6YAT6_9FLAO|nr:hypothetical protein [Flavobacterium nackdongense]QBN17757.1 hypothetical protein E1750_02710 [Flavobacterium nackdongense]
MQNTKPKNDRLEEVKRNGYQLDFATVFESAFENYKKIALYAGLILLVFSILSAIGMMTALVSYIGVENLEHFANTLKEFSQLKVMPLEVALPLNAGLILYSALITPFMSGFLKMAYCGEKGEEFHVSTMFSYYKSPYFLPIVVSVFIISLVGTGLAMLLEYAGLSFVGTVTTMLVSFLTFLTIPLIVFGNLNVSEAIKSSIIIVSKQPLVLLGLLIVAGIGALLGIFGFCFGIFFTWPFMYSMTYVIYKTIFGIDEVIEIEEITESEN